MTYQSSRPAVGAPGMLLLPSGMGTYGQAQQSLASAALTASQGYYIPYSPPYDTGVATMAFYGAAGTNNHDLGIYDAAYNRLVSRGATASTAGAVNVWTLTTPQAVSQGKLYYAAYSTAGTATLTTLPNSNILMNQLGLLTQAIGATALPVTMVPAVPGANAFPILRLTFTG